MTSDEQSQMHFNLNPIARLFKKNIPATILGILLICALIYIFCPRPKPPITDSIREELVQVAKVNTYEYNFTEILYLDKANNPLNWHNPITSSRYVATIDGTVNIGTNVENMQVRKTKNPDGTIRTVTITVPHAVAEDPNLDPHTLKKYVEDKGIFDIFKPSTDDYNNMEKVAEEKQLQKIKDSGVLKKADTRLVNLLTTFVQQTCGEDVKVNVLFDDSLA